MNPKCFSLFMTSYSPKRTATHSQNSFIIFRKDYQVRITVEQGPEIGLHLKDISRSASLFWRSCSPEDKYMYDRICSRMFERYSFGHFLYVNLPGPTKKCVSL
ncbi:7444_t:CDS:2 [Acaulospora morrowiae]|uniref:7444_t:CDS:1 n=1 Tax=Acaulospora morrowiae TaxID=94023 RepID=A0A9N9BJV3_9GLOM|nr:7444_t:CDS:2 [Acaulospora morrowiae]